MPLTCGAFADRVWSLRIRARSVSPTSASTRALRTTIHNRGRRRSGVQAGSDPRRSHHRGNGRRAVGERTHSRHDPARHRDHVSRCRWRSQSNGPGCAAGHAACTITPFGGCVPVADRRAWV